MADFRGGNFQNQFYQQKSFNGVIFNHHNPQTWIRPTPPTQPTGEPIISQHPLPVKVKEPERFKKVTQPLLSQIKSVTAMQKPTTVSQPLVNQSFDNGNGEHWTPFGPKASLKRPQQR